jgi:hypothetical protein
MIISVREWRYLLTTRGEKQDFIYFKIYEVQWEYVRVEWEYAGVEWEYDGSRWTMKSCFSPLDWPLPPFLLPRVFFIFCCVMTKFTQIPQPLERYPCIGYHYPSGDDQIHSNSSTSRKISMQRDIVTRRVMTKFTQIPQLLERYLCIGYHYPLGNDQIHSNSSTSRKISMYPNIVTRRVMTKFTQIPQLLERYPCIQISLPVG